MSLADQSQQWYPTSVQVTVLQARGLRIKGKNGTNDAYAIMQVAKEKYATTVVEKSVAPMWKEEASFDLPLFHHGNADRCMLHVHVMHRALIGPDKLLGQAVINLPELSEGKDRKKTEWFKLVDKAGKTDKDRGEVLLDIQFLRNNMTASMFDLSAGDKPRSRLGKLKDKVRGKKKEGLSDSVSAVVPAFTQVLTDSEEEGEGGVHGDADQGADKEEKKKKKHKLKSLFSPKSNLQKNMSQSMSVLASLPEKNSTLSSSRSSGLNMDSSEGKKKFKFLTHKRSGSSDSKSSQGSLSLLGRSKHGSPPVMEHSNLCINGSHVYSEEPQPRTSRAGSNFSLASSGHGSMGSVEDLHSRKTSVTSADSLRPLKQHSPWAGEEEKSKEEEDHRKLEEEEEERKQISEEEKEIIGEIEEEKRGWLEEEETAHLEEERRRNEEKIRMEEQERARIEEEERRAEEEERRREKEKMERLAEEEKRRLVEEERRKEEELRSKREEEETMERMREEERRREEEEEERLRREMEEKFMKEEEERLKREEESRREEEERRIREEEERQREEEMRIREEEERKIQEEERRERVEEEKRLRKEVEEKRKMEEELRVKREEERRLREEEEERRRREEEERRKEEERQKKVEEENRRMEEEKRRIEEERVKKEEEEEVERQKIEEEEKRRKRGEEVERRKREEEERRKKEEEEVEERRTREEWRKREEEKQKREEEEKRKREEEEERKKREEEDVEERRTREEEVERRKGEEGVEDRRKREEEEEERRLAVEERLRREEEQRKHLEDERRREEERGAEEEQKARVEEERRKEEKRGRDGQMDEDRKAVPVAMLARVPFTELPASSKPPDHDIISSTNQSDDDIISSTNQSDDDDIISSTNPFEEEVPSSPAAALSRSARVSTVKPSFPICSNPPQPVVPSSPFLEEPSDSPRPTSPLGGQEASGALQQVHTDPLEKKRCAPLPPSTKHNPPDKPASAKPNLAPIKPSRLNTTSRDQAATLSVRSGEELSWKESVGPDGKEPAGAQRDKRPAPQPPPQTERQTQRGQSVSTGGVGQTDGQKREILPQRLVQMIAPLSRASPLKEVQVTSGQSSAQCSSQPEPTPSTTVSRHSKGPAPSKPHPSSGKILPPVREEPKRPLSSSDAKQKNANIQLTEQGEITSDPKNLSLDPRGRQSSTNACLPDPLAVGSNPPDEDNATKNKSSKTIRAPLPLAKKTATAGNQSSTNQSAINASLPDSSPTLCPTSPSSSSSHPAPLEMSVTTGGVPAQPQAVTSASDHLTLLPSAAQPVAVQGVGEEAGGKGEGPTSASRRPHPVKPLSSLEQQQQQQPVIQAALEIKPTAILSSVQHHGKERAVGLGGPYSQLTQAELISLLVKQQKQLSEKDKKIGELEQYIDNLLVRVIEEQPSILMSLNSIKRGL